MKYMLIIYSVESNSTATERKNSQAETNQLISDLKATGNYVDSNSLHPAVMASSLRVRDGKRLVAEGPFALTDEQFCAYLLIDVEDFDEAIAIAGRIPAARVGTVEIRPVFELAE